MIPRGYVNALAAAVERVLAGLPGEAQYAVAWFHGALRCRALSPDTVRLYCRALAGWFAAGGAPGHLDLDRLGRWMYQRAQVDGVGPAARNIALKALRAWYRYAAGMGWASVGEAARVPRRYKEPQRLVRYLTDAECDLLLAAPAADTFLGVRDRALLAVLVDTGLRATEAAQLEVCDITVDGMLYVLGKGGKRRYAPTTPRCRAALDAWLLMRSQARIGHHGALWPATNGRALTGGRSVWLIVRRHAEAALGLRQGGFRLSAPGGRAWTRTSPHVLRASCATSLLNGGMDVLRIAQVLGHTSADTTARYTGVDIEALRRVVALHPRAKRRE